MKKITALLIALCLFAPAVFAQTGGQTSSGTNASQSISLDTPVTVHLVGSVPINLTYQSGGGETIAVTARMVDPNSTIDPMVTLMDANGATLAFNDDHDAPDPNLSDRDAVIPSAALTSAGSYTVQVASFSDTGQGDVEVTVSSAQGGLSVQPPPTASGNNATTANTQVIHGTVPANAPYTTTLSFNEGDVVTISVHATDNTLDPKLALLDSTGATVAANDDQTTDSSLGPYNSQIANLAIPKTDTYTIEVNGFAGIGGTFDLTIAYGAPGSGTTAVATPQFALPSTPSAGNNVQTYSGTVNANDVYTTNFDGQVGDVYTITVQATNSDFDPRVSLYLNNKWVADNDDYGTTDPNLAKTDSRIYDLILHDSGSYEVDVRGYQDSSGPFNLTIEKVATGAPTGAPTEHVELGSVDASSIYSYQFQAQAGDWVTITARGLTDSFDPYISLASADGTVLFDNDDNGSSDASLGYYNSRIPNYHITTSGTYTVEVSGVGGVGGSFGLTIGILH